MRAAFNRAELLSAAKRGESIVPHNTPMDALKGLLLEVDSGGILTMTASNLEVTLEQKIPCKSSEEIPLCSVPACGEDSVRSIPSSSPHRASAAGTPMEEDAVVLDARLAVAMLDKLPGDTVELERKPGQPQICVRGGKAEYQVPVSERNAYPKLQIPSPEDAVMVSGVPSMAKRTVFAAAEDNGKPVLKCVNLRFTQDGLRAAVGNGSCIVTAKGDEKSTGDTSLLIPALSLEKLARMCGDKDEFRVSSTGKSIIFRKENFAYSARLLEEDYIDTDSLIRSVQNQFTVLTDVAELRSMAETASCVDLDGKICLLFEGQRLTFRYRGEQGNTAVSMDVIPLTGMPQGEYCYISRLLRACLKSLSGTVKLGIAQSGMLTLEAENAYYLQTATRLVAAAAKKPKKPSGKRAA